MAKFCGKCGTKLDEVTGLCPNCDADKLKKQNETPEVVEIPKQKQDTASEPKMSLSKKEAKKQRKADKKAAKKDKKDQKKAAKKEQKKEKWASMTFGQKVLKLFKKAVLGILLLAIFACGIIGTFVYFKIVDFPLLEDFIRENEIINFSENVERDVSETDTSGFVLYQSSEKNIVSDSENGVTFVNNEVLVTIDSSKNKNELESYISKIGGTIVGEIPELADYQILLDKEYDIEDLYKIVNGLSEQRWVVSAAPNYCMKIDAQYIPNDKKWSRKWGDIPEGTNWGVEAIDVQEAWDYQNKMTSTVNIGVIDDMFDVNHEDLVFAEVPLGNVSATKNDSKWSDHGTHTSGTIAATTNNKLGISGISINDNLYGASYIGLGVCGYDTSQSMKIALYYLIATKDCSVINMSIGTDHLTFEASRDCTLAINELNNLASSIEILLQELIDRDYQFVICKSAGNQNEVDGNYQYFRKNENDEDYPYEYYSYSDYLKYLSGESGYEYFADYKDEKDAIERRLESGNVDAKYDFLGTIENQAVKDRIIVVGAVESLGTHKEGGFLWFGRKTVHDGYSIASFSQCGDRVDVLAPGVDIYSCVKNGYSNMSGTSMAAPHVSGVASLLFSVNPSLSANDVKRIICDTSVGSYGDESCGLLNAKNAAESALSYVPSSGQTEESGGKFELTDIPSDAVEFNGHYYKVIQDGATTDWNAALQYCNARNGYLATITSQEENDFLYSYIKQEGYESAYFGLSDAAYEGTWTWANGEAVTYTNWHKNEPNGENSGEDYALFYYKYSDGTWNEGDFGNRTVNSGTAFICEWGEYEVGESEKQDEPIRTTSDERDIVLVLDVSGSMSGTPMTETKKAAVKFINTILKEDASISIVTYDDYAQVMSDFTANESRLTSIVSGINSGGLTNTYDGLYTANNLLQNSNAEKKIIVLMSDGVPNEGKTGDDLIDYADTIKETGTYIYTIGFFEALGYGKSSAQNLMEELASDGCHYEVANADDLIFFFGDIADQINGQKYVYVRIACPVEVIVTYNGESLSSSEKNFNARTSFGVLTLEEEEDSDDKIKTLRLKADNDYDIKIEGTGRGKMDYTIGYMDDSGDYSDMRRFRNIDVTRRTVIDTSTKYSKNTVLNVDEDGDGKYDLKFRAGENEYGELVDYTFVVYIVLGAIGVIVVAVAAMIIRKKSRKKTKQ